MVGMNTDIHTAVRVLNEAFVADPSAIHALLCNRVPCNLALADHPTVQVQANPVIEDGKTWTVGLIGMLNGVLEPLTGQRVAAQWEDGKLLGFQVYIGSPAAPTALEQRVTEIEQLVNKDTID